MFHVYVCAVHLRYVHLVRCRLFLWIWAKSILWARSYGALGPQMARSLRSVQLQKKAHPANIGMRYFETFVLPGCAQLDIFRNQQTMKIVHLLSISSQSNVNKVLGHTQDIKTAVNR